MTKRNSNSQRKLSFQQLENRQLMAANVLAAPLAPPIKPAPAPPPAQVQAFLANGVLTINGDSGNDAVTITQPTNSPNEFVLTSTNGTLFNGNNTKLDFKGVTGAINITFKGVAESLTIGTGSLVSIPANLTVNMGNGTNGFYMYDANVHGALNLTGGNGTDYASISESTIGSPNVNGGANDLTIMLGGGVNGISLENNVKVERDLNLLSPSSTGDTIFMADGISAGRYVYINTGNGNDNLTLAGVTAGSQLNIQTFGGNDTVRLGGMALGSISPVVADSIYLNLGAGNDFLQIGGDGNNHKAGGIFTAHGSTYDGGTGSDSLWNEGFNYLSGVTNFEVLWTPAY